MYQVIMNVGPKKGQTVYRGIKSMAEIYAERATMWTGNPQAATIVKSPVEQWAK